MIENCTLGDDVLIRQSCVLEDQPSPTAQKSAPSPICAPAAKSARTPTSATSSKPKKPQLGKGAKANHLTYLGDAEIGEGNNIGAGTITCNYDGVKKHKTQSASASSSAATPPWWRPSPSSDGSYIGAGSCITKNVPARSLAVSRAQQITKEGWAAARRANAANQEPSELLATVCWF